MVGEFLELVTEMRRLQIEFFKTRDYDTLKRSKEYEKRVDKMIKLLTEGPELFPDANQ